jgi:uncharacterized protein (DUF58 family)
VRREAGPALQASVLVAIAGVIGALALRRPELAAIAAPFVLLTALGLRSRPPDVRAWFEHDAGERALEGGRLETTITVNSSTGVERLEVGLVLPRGVVPVEGAAAATAVHLAPGAELELPLELELRRWGSVTLGDLRLRARDRTGLVRWEGRVDRGAPLRIYPSPTALRELVDPARTQTTTGGQVARTRGDGIEFADTRPFVVGDRLRSVNWRASARRTTLVVNERHPERNADVVLFLDSFAEAREDGADDGTLEHAVRVVATLADRLLERRDRVGLVTFGGILQWLEPGGGIVQRYRLLDALLRTDVRFSYAWRDVNVIPARMLPPRALVIGVSPLLDERSVGALLDLGARGHDLVVVEVSPEPYAMPGPTDGELLAHRLWRLQRAALRARLGRLGVAVVTVEDAVELDHALEGVRSYRRHARLARR